VRSLQTFGSLFDFELDLLAFLEGAEPFGLYGAVVDEDVRPPSRARKPKPFDALNHLTVPVTRSAILLLLLTVNKKE